MYVDVKNATQIEHNVLLKWVHVLPPSLIYASYLYRASDVKSGKRWHSGLVHRPVISL